MFQDNNKPKQGNTPTPQQANIVQDLSTSVGNEAINKIVPQESVSKVQKGVSYAQMANNTFIKPKSLKKENSFVEKPLWAPQPTSKIYNAKNIPEQEISGINRVVKLGLVVEGQSIKHFKHFELIQSAKKHHEFTVELAHDYMGEAENHRLESAQKLLGKRLTAIFNYKDVEDSPERVFVGVVTEVGFSQDRGSLGNIILKGYSPTILLDAAPHTQSFGGDQPISLTSIADNVIKEGLNKSMFDYRVAASYGNISYSSQYDETHYNYLARMAEAYGEQFFYDGEVLHFGELPSPEKPIKLVYGSNLHDVKINMKANHVNPSFYGYNSSKDEKLTTGPSSINHVSDIAKRAYNISEQTFKTPSLRIAPIKSATSMDIAASQKSTAGSNAVDVFVTSGNTSVPFLYPGCIADIEMRQQDSSKTSYFTKLMITEVTHKVDGRGYYDGHFEAIAADTGFIPRPEFVIPKAQAQVAKVVSNTDPQNQGRIQVQFDWQMGGNKTEFIRVMTPDAGGSDKVSTNRGFMAIPEVGDQVMIGFQHDHPDRPFALGGMFHGKVGGGGGSGNNVKSLSSKSGHTVSLDDGGGMTLRDKDQNSVFLDGAGNISVDSKISITLKCGASSIYMDKDGNIVIEGKELLTKGINVMTQGENVGVAGTTSVGIGVGPEDGDPTSGIGIKSDTVDLGTTTLTLGAESEANLGAKVINIGGGSETNIVSGTVKLN